MLSKKLFIQNLWYCVVSSRASKIAAGCQATPNQTLVAVASCCLNISCCSGSRSKSDSPKSKKRNWSRTSRYSNFRRSCSARKRKGYDSLRSLPSNRTGNRLLGRKLSFGKCHVTKRLRSKKNFFPLQKTCDEQEQFQRIEFSFSFTYQLKRE